MAVDRAKTTEATITGLRSSTIYSIEVAVVNSAGTGVYSEPKVNTTLPSEGVMLFKITRRVIKFFLQVSTLV